jgi:hypothetical protein
MKTEEEETVSKRKVHKKQEETRRENQRMTSPQLPGTHHQLWIFSCGFCWLAYAYEK